MQLIKGDAAILLRLGLEPGFDEGDFISKTTEFNDYIFSENYRLVLEELSYRKNYVKILQQMRKIASKNQLEYAEIKRIGEKCPKI